MKRVPKKKVETDKEFIARTLLQSLDSQIADLEGINYEIESLFQDLQGRLTSEQKEELEKVLSDALKASDKVAKNL